MDASGDGRSESSDVTRVHEPSPSGEFRRSKSSPDIRKKRKLKFFSDKDKVRVQH